MTIKNTKKVVFFCLNSAKVLKIQARGERMKAKQIFGLVFIGLFFIIIIFCIPIQNTSSLSADDYLRIHIRANSNSSADQKVKYEIKDRRPGDIATCYADPTRAKEELDWVATRGIEDMCRDTWNYALKHK